MASMRFGSMPAANQHATIRLRLVRLCLLGCDLDLEVLERLMLVLILLLPLAIVRCGLGLLQLPLEVWHPLRLLLVLVAVCLDALDGRGVCFDDGFDLLFFEAHSFKELTRDCQDVAPFPRRLRQTLPRCLTIAQPITCQVSCQKKGRPEGRPKERKDAPQGRM